MRVINKSRKNIAISGELLLPGAEMELPNGMETHPIISFYLEKGILVDKAKNTASAGENTLSDEERKRIAEDAIAKYKAEQEALAAAASEKEAEIKTIKSMKKQELLEKAAGMGLEVEDGITADELKEKIVAALTE